MASYPSILPTIYESLMLSQYAPPERRLAEQRKNLAGLIRFAREQVPFYRSRLDALLTPSGDVDWDRWNEVPILTRADVVDAGDTLLPPALPPGHGYTKAEFTSGSTGVPLRVIQSQLSNVVLTANTYRAYRWHGLDWSQDMLVWFGEDPEKGTLPDGEAGAPWGPGWMTEARGRRVHLNRFLGPDAVLSVLQRRGMPYLGARPMAAQSVALEAMRLGRDVRLDAVVTFSTGARPDEREDCLKAFGARMIVPYSAKEGQFMAYQCPTGPHFHINEESVLVEIVDDDGYPCPPGQMGRVIVTPIYNYAQPLIRYEQGDLAAFGEPCTCGRTLKVIDRVAGRISHLFRLPDGQKIAMSLEIGLQAAVGAKYWQIAQVGPLRIEVRYVPREGSVAEPGGEARVADVIRRKTCPEMQIKFSRRTDLNRADGRKFIEYVCELDD